MPDKDLRLLALDGGGVRGLSALMILQQLMETIDPDNPPKPCNYFDMIGGTSTGGLIAIMLGRLKMSIIDCINAYLSFSDRVFQRKRNSLTVDGNIKGRFDSEGLTRAVKELLIAQGLQEDALLKDVSEDLCKVFVCATSQETNETVCLTSYESPHDGSDLVNNLKIWEACRATSAASSFFNPITVGRHNTKFVDGPTRANNPIWELWDQAQLIWGPQPLESRIKCLVSIGTGLPSSKLFHGSNSHIGEVLKSIATETEETAVRFRRDKSHFEDSGRYYRFNVERGLEDVGLEESKKRGEITAATQRYIGSQGVVTQMQACADDLAGREHLPLAHRALAATATDTVGADSLTQRPARHSQPPNRQVDNAEHDHEIPSLRQPQLPILHCKMCNILFYLWISLATTSLAIGLWRSLATSDEGKGFTDAAYVVAVGGLVIYPIQNRHALRCKLKE
ncbi:hypothetical protein G7Y89_g5568 [Cudoniella acicularis]|uniref:PNPLA domain-containing protein n=1 Tax=Cudoniella acicularis TaxID=354080 RepID=A0A8H4RQG0_9HELO|nr:hypothetical protein G7Y89_g5568 [Cudoniella acicularis]